MKDQDLMNEPMIQNQKTRQKFDKVFKQRAVELWLNSGKTAVDLAVRAHVRHAHTNYDELLMAGTDRLDARAQVREKIDRVLAEWSGD